MTSISFSILLDEWSGMNKSELVFLLRNPLHLWHHLHERGVYENFHKFRKRNSDLLGHLIERGCFFE